MGADVTSIFRVVAIKTLGGDSGRMAQVGFSIPREDRSLYGAKNMMVCLRNTSAEAVCFDKIVRRESATDNGVQEITASFQYDGDFGSRICVGGFEDRWIVLKVSPHLHRLEFMAVQDTQRGARAGGEMTEAQTAPLRGEVTKRSDGTWHLRMN